MLGGNWEEKDTARHLLRKMVNSMSSKMEIGSPMASMYLLGHPDHYASHRYVTFWWKSYVHFVRSFWLAESGFHNSEGEEDDEKVPIGKQDGKFVATSGVNDYRYCPIIYNNVTLYEWIQCSEKKARNQKERLEFEEEVRMAKYMRADYYRAAVKRLEEEGEAFDEDVEDSLEDDNDYCPQDNPDADGTPDILTNVIPNFIGGALPRSDKGDRSFYCLTMMTLFKPWRSPTDLKDSESTWEQTFNEHEFNARQKELMRNFNVRYECNDARDDHFATMKKKMAAAEAAGISLFTSDIMGVKDDFAADLNEFDYGSDDEEMDEEITDEEKGPRTLKMQAQAKEMIRILQNCGWLMNVGDQSENQTPQCADTLLPPFKRRSEWNNIVKHQRAQLISNKLADMPSLAELQERRRQVKNDVTIVPHDFFNRVGSTDAQSHANEVAKIVTTFKLNVEQERAFRIVADHAAAPQLTPLRMYLGGMGGTGKSQVLKAISAFFVMRKEEYRYMVLGPTGSVVALLNGST
ncbi:hypothetical protein C8R44DRAFT_560449, partial [Mycena epipterygia]